MIFKITEITGKIRVKYTGARHWHGELSTGSQKFGAMLLISLLFNSSTFHMLGPLLSIDHIIPSSISDKQKRCAAGRATSFSTTKQFHF